MDGDDDDNVDDDADDADVVLDLQDDTSFSNQQAFPTPFCCLSRSQLVVPFSSRPTTRAGKREKERWPDAWLHALFSGRHKSIHPTGLGMMRPGPPMFVTFGGAAAHFSQSVLLLERYSSTKNNNILWWNRV